MNGDTSAVRGIFRRVSDELSYLQEAVLAESSQPEPDIHHVLNAYLGSRRKLSAELRALAEETLVGDLVELDRTIGRIEETMRLEYRGIVPDRLLKVRGYRGIHGVLAEYLSRNAGTPVTGSLLRLLSGDQVHTERRIRELRDLGYQLKAERVAGEDIYVLDVPADVAGGALLQLKKNVRDDRKATEAEKAGLLAELERHNQ